MRILHLINSTNPAGGGPIESIVQANHALRQKGHEADVVCLDRPDAPWLPSLPFSVFCLGPAWTRYRYSPRLVKWLRSHAQEYNAVIVHGIWLFPSLGAWLALRDGGPPYFIYVHGMLDPVLKMHFPIKHLAKTFLWKLAEWRVTRDAAALLFTCDEEKRLAEKSFRPFLGHGEVVPYCVGDPPPESEAQRTSFMALLPKEFARPFILFLSRIHPKKGCDILISSFAAVSRKFPEWKLVVAGPDPVGWRSRLQRMAREAGVYDKIAWLEMLSGEAKWGAFRSAECFVLPSHQENFGIAIVEALACGTPVIISKRVNIWREVTSQGGGLACEDSVESVRSTLERMITMSHKERMKMKADARQCFEKTFRSNKAAETLLNVLSRYCGGGKNGG